VGGQVQETGLGDPVTKAAGMTEYVLHGTKNQGGTAPWNWVVLTGSATTSKVQVSAGAL
jgi:hypothetical protein